MQKRESKTNPFYRVWWHIRSRCIHKWNKDYKRYGARGIKFKWKDYDSFKKDMYISYLVHVKKHGKKNTSIDRINSKGHYSKKNCRWATLQEQSLNKSSSRFFTFEGITMNYSEWAKNLGCSRQALRYRIVKGIDPKIIVNTPFRHSNKFT